MTNHPSIKSLYPLALAEAEGVGTAYEYFAKRLVLRPWLSGRSIRRILIAGLPEKYGSSLDFLLLAVELNVYDPLIVDERPAALEKNRKSLAAAQKAGELKQLQPTYQLMNDMGQLYGSVGPQDLCISSEVLQRLPAPGRRGYIESISRVAASIALFAPNADNGHHTSISGLSGLHRDEMQELAKTAGVPKEVGYIDMPPFPPGITRSSDQRSQASSGFMEGFAMWGLGVYAHAEHFFPSGWRRTQSHIVYALVDR